MLWDHGTFRVGGNNPSAALRAGKLHLFLEGEKLHGEWALIRLRKEKDQWLLLKAGEPLKPKARVWDRSVTTHRKMEEIAHAVEMPSFVEPMKAKLAAEPPHGDGWLYELKFDGYRFLAAKAGKKVRLWSRTEHDFTTRFPDVARALATLKAHGALVDGELVVPDEKGRPSFQLIQNADEKTPVHAFVFDLLEIDGEDIRREPLEARRARLAALLPRRASTVHFSAELKGEASALLTALREQGLEGLIAKRRNSVYETGRRSGAWLKIKCVQEQEFVIGGFTAPKGSRAHFGALLLGYYHRGKLAFAGKVGTGFDAKTLAALRRQMQAHRRAKCPFARLPTGRSRWGPQFTRAELAKCTWLEPRLVAQVRFAEWTDDGLLRQPTYLGLREDKSAREVVRET
jgi:bifunctional non-homologous end joining protein LigD